MDDIVNQKIASMEYFFEAVKKVREEQGLSQLDIAGFSGMTPQNLSRLLKGKRTPGIDTAERIAAALGYDLVDFLALGRSLTEGDKPPINPEVAGYLDKARAVLEGPKGEALKTVIESLLKE